MSNHIKFVPNFIVLQGAMMVGGYIDECVLEAHSQSSSLPLDH